MLKEIMKFNEPGFYQEKCDLINNTVENYLTAQNNNNLLPEEVSNVKVETEEILRNIMIENGFRDEETSYINIDKEFFTEGTFDKSKLEKYKKEMLLNYSEQQLKWTFAGTTSSYSPISRKNLSENGVDYPEMLPLNLKNKFLKKQSEKFVHNKKSDFHVFLYGDGTTSNQYVPEKAPVSLNSIKDHSGFDWQKGYSPKNKIKKNNWKAGFNNSDEWEQFSNNEKAQIYNFQNIANPLISFSPDSNIDSNHLGFLNIPDTGEVFLFDNLSILMEGREEEFYSLSGDIYGIREVDKETTTNYIKNYLTKNNINQISNIVVKNKSKKTIEFYKDLFKGYITDNTKFYSANEKKLQEKLNKAKEEIQSNEISNEILSGFFTLSSKGRTTEEIYNGLIPTVSQKEYDIDLNIFNTEEDLNSFISAPEIKNDLDDETIHNLKEIEVPENKKRPLSNAIQNLLYNFHLFKHSNITKPELIELAKDLIVNNKSAVANKIKVPAEMNLADFIKNMSTSSKLLKIPSFKSKTKHDSESLNITTKSDFKKWAFGESSMEKDAVKKSLTKNSSTGENNSKESLTKNSSTGENNAKKSLIKNSLTGENNAKESLIENSLTGKNNAEKTLAKQTSGKLLKLNIPTNIINEIETFITTATIPEEKKEKFSAAVINSFDEYSSILTSTGIPALELVQIIKDIIVNNNIESKIKNKRIFFEKNLTDVIKESTEENLYKQKEIKSDIYLEKNNINNLKEINLLDKLDLKTFVLSSYIQKNGISDSDAKKIENYINQVSIPVDKSRKYSSAVIQSIKSYKNKFEPNGISPLNTVEMITNAIGGNFENIPEQVKPFVFLISGNADKLKSLPNSQETFIEDDIENLILSNDEDLETFVSIPYIKNSDLNEDEIQEFKTSIKEVQLPANNIAGFNNAIANTMKNYKKKIMSSGISITETVKHIAENFDTLKKNVKIPSEIKSVINSSKKGKQFYKQFNDNVFSNLNNIDLTDEKNIETFAKSPLFSSLNLESNDSKSILNYLKTANVSSSNKRKFSKGVINILNDYKKKFSSQNISPLNAVKSIHYAINKQTGKIPEGLQNEINNYLSNDPVLKNQKRPQNINLYNNSEYSEFIKSAEFKNSGLNEDQFKEILSQHNDSYNGIQNKYLSTLPLLYKTKPEVYSNAAAENNSIISMNPGQKLKYSSNDVFNTGWKVSKTGNSFNNIKLTGKASQVINENNYGPGNLSFKNNKLPDNNSNNLDQPQQNLLNDQMVYSTPLIKARPGGSAQRTSNLNNQNFNNRQIVNSQNQQNLSDSKMQRIQQNYEFDKRMLAKSDGEASAPSSRRSNSSDGNKIQKTLDDLFNEFTNRINDDF